MTTQQDRLREAAEALSKHWNKFGPRGLGLFVEDVVQALAATPAPAEHAARLSDETSQDLAIAYMKGYADANALAIEREASEDVRRDAIATAYGYLWHVNNEPGTPVPMYSPEKAAYEARRVLRDLLTHEQRGEAINRVRAAIVTQRKP